MGSIKKALKPVTRVVDNIIPNEIKPALPYLAASFGAPYLAGKGILSALGTGAFGKGVSASLINAATNAALGRKFNPVSAATSGIMAGGGQFLTDNFDSKLAQSAGKFLSPGAVGDMTLGQAAVASSGSLTAGSMQAAFEEAEKANREYDDYVRQQEEAGAADIQTRRDYITRYMGMAGFDQDQIDDALSRYGYKTGGRVGFAEGGDTLGEKMSDMKILLMKNDIIESGKLGFDVKDIDTYSDDKIIEIHESLFGQGNKNGGRIGLAFGGMNDPKIPSDNIIDSMIQESTEEEKGIMTTRNDRIGTLMNLLQAEQMSDNPDLDKIMIYKAELADLMGSRTGAAEGGIMNLKMGGIPAEMDLRGGGFVPLGAKERADDVPARLSKNEFVMTADAVRAAGGGSVNKGAKRMYDLMNNLEARV